MRVASNVEEGKAAFRALTDLLETAPSGADIRALSVHMLLIDRLLQSLPVEEFEGVPSFPEFARSQWATLAGVAADVNERGRALRDDVRADIVREASDRWQGLRARLPWLDDWQLIPSRILAYETQRVDPRNPAADAVPRLDHSWVDGVAPGLSVEELEASMRELEAAGEKLDDVVVAVMPYLFDRSDPESLAVIADGLRQGGLSNRELAVLAPAAVATDKPPVELAYERVDSVEIRRRLEPGTIEIEDPDRLRADLAGYAEASEVPFDAADERFWTDQLARGLERLATGDATAAQVHFRRAEYVAKGGLMGYAAALAGIGLCMSARYDDAVRLLSHADLREDMDWHGALERVDRSFNLRLLIGVTREVTIEIPFSARAAAWTLAGAAVRAEDWQTATAALAAIGGSTFSEADTAAKALEAVPSTAGSLSALAIALRRDRLGDGTLRELALGRAQKAAVDPDAPWEEIAAVITAAGINSSGITDQGAFELVAALPSLELQRSVLERMSDAARRGLLGASDSVEAALDRVEAGERLTPETFYGGDSAEPDELEATPHSDLLRQRVAAGDDREIDDLLLEAISEPEWPLLRDEVFMTLDARGDWQSIFRLTKRIGYESISGQARLSYARALATAGQHDAAIEVLGQAVNADDLAHSARTERARLLISLGRRGQARRDITQLIIEDPTDDTVRVLSEELNTATATERQPIPREVKDRVWQRDRGRCAECGSQQLLEFDHVIPLAMGGSNTERNLQLLCEACNRAKAAAL